MFVILWICVGLASGCGGGGGDCADKTCSLGTCEASSGECVNSSTCYVDADCVAGYVCNSQRECVGQTDCSSDADCDPGVCNDDGVCVNGSSCKANSDCIERTFCTVEGTCAPDPCNDVRCPRGVCERGTDNCVSRDSCTQRTETEDCVRGEYCVDGTCQPADDICDGVTCERGVCSPEAGGCGNATDCQGDSSRCLEGYFCNSMNTCRPDVCEQRGVECDRGSCNPLTGECENATSCESNDDCLADHLCVEGTCRLESAACGDASGDGGCPGNQVCEYDAMDRSTTCVEPEVCETSFDCNDGRQCAGLSCRSFGPCEADLFEPNDAMGEATDLVTAGRLDSRAEGTLCRGDVDRFTFDTTDFVNPAVTGPLVVEVDIPPRDTGLGGVNVALMKDGNELDSAQSGPRGRRAHLSVSTPITINNHGTYTVVLQAQDDMTAAGLTYALSANVVPKSTRNACEGAQRLRANQSLAGTTLDGASSSLGSQCTSATNESSEVIYRVEVDSPQQMTFQLTPQTSGSDLSMSLRRSCLQPSSEQACVDRADTGESESLTALLNRGTYFLVVQAGADGTGGPFEVLATTTLKACTPQDDYCAGEDTAQRCTPAGGRFQQVECDEGCNPSTGACYPPAGDGCQEATSITPAMTDADGLFTQEIELRQFDDSHGIDFGGCLGSDAPRTTGPDRVYEVTIPAQRGFTAEVDFANNAEGSVYVSESCPDIAGTCQRGAAQSTEQDGLERLTVSNRTDQSVTRYLVIDSRADQLLGAASLELSYKDVICTPGMQQCAAGDAIEECNVTGTDYEAVKQCGYTCSSATCQAETCMSAPTIPNDGTEHTYLLDLGEFVNDYNLIGSSSTCLDRFTTTKGREAVFQFQANAGEVVDLTWEPLSNAAIYVVSNCSNLTGSCVAGNESLYAGSRSGNVTSTFSLDQGGTYYVMADARGGGTSYGTSTLKARIVEPSCQPKSGACSSGGNFKYCNTYEIYDTYTCSNCCSTLGTGSSSPSLAVPDNDAQGVSDSLTVSGCSGTIKKLYVDVEATHPFADDLELELTGPGGTSATLQDNDVGFQADIDALYPESQTPTDSLSVFQGVDPTGTWTLDVADTQQSNSGTLDRWAVYAACN